MLTIFTIPKPFQGHIGIIQRNAIQSWMVLSSELEIILLGDDDGVAEVAQEFGLGHIPEVTCNEYGTPLLNSVFELAQTTARYSILTYVNADIILLDDFVTAIRRIPFSRFVMVGQRWNLDVSQPLDFDQPNWEICLRDNLSKKGTLFEPWGIDYFVFSSNLWESIPPFAIGRYFWDNWLVFQARACGAAVIDATKVVTAIHQNHDYAHMAGGVNLGFEGPEARRNFALVGSHLKRFNVHDANWVLGKRWLFPSLALKGKLERWYLYLAMHQPMPYRWTRMIVSPVYKAVLSMTHHIGGYSIKKKNES